MSPKRAVEWWCLLNAHHRPSDVPPEMTTSDAFDYSIRNTTKEERLLFWNNEFKTGLNWRKYIDPQ